MEDDSEGRTDKAGLKELLEARARIGAEWREGTSQILQERNPNLLSELDRVEKIIDSLLVIKNKPAPLRKQWREAMAEYESIAMLCIKYAERHMMGRIMAAQK